MTGEELLRQSRQTGKAEGKAESILVVLSSKFDISEALLEKILCQKDASVLDKWLVSAVGATSVEDFMSKIS